MNFEDKLIVRYNQKTKVLTVKSNNTLPFEKVIEFGHWQSISNEKDELQFEVQLIHEGDGKYVFNVKGLDELDQPEGYDLYDILNNQSITIIGGEENKYVFIALDIQNGEYQYRSRMVHIIPKELNVDDFGDDCAKEFYGNFSHSDGFVHYFNGGEVAVENGVAQEITKEEYDVLNKFLSF
jgi:hypothetical protein